MDDHRFIPSHDPMLPEPLRQLAAPVRGLWWAGERAALGRGIRIGIVGSRQPRVDSEHHARTIARDAGRMGLTVVSGLAIGIDGVAHRAALAGGGDTIAVLAGGLAHVHPTRHRDLARQIAGSSHARGVRAGAFAGARGAVVTEYGVGEEPSYPNRFTERNRIIAALSDYLVVVQAKPRSGSMSTVRVALELGIPVGIVPSAPEDPCYGGSLELVREGADCVVDGRSLCLRLEANGVVRRGFADAVRDGAVADPDRPGEWMGAPEGAVEPSIPPGLVNHPLASMLDVPRQLDEIADLAGMTVRDARRMLLELEANGDIVFTDDGQWVSVGR